MIGPAIFALPGLMPPTSPVAECRITAAEDGSLCLCVWRGKMSDVVTYALRLHGFAGGVLKDPSYAFDNSSYGKYLRSASRRWLQFMTITNYLPGAAQVVRRVIGRRAVPVTESETGNTYWILTIPRGVLAVGDNTLEVCVNGAVMRYFIARPHFEMHACDDAAALFGWEEYIPNPMNLSLLHGQEAVIELNVDDDGPPFTALIAEYAQFRGTYTTAEGDEKELVISKEYPYLKLYTQPEDLYGTYQFTLSYSYDDEEWVDLLEGAQDMDSKGNPVLIHLSEWARAFLMSNTEGTQYRASCNINGLITQLDASVSGNTLSVTFPATLPVGSGEWSAEYSFNGEDWGVLKQGELNITEEEAK